ncbi:MAG: glycosyltransferase [Flavobacteriales bacterium]|nr:glycosyltransferase [Flavobacteriales bacterium]
MKISIITATYNSDKTITDTIQSIAEQSFDDIEYLVIDGESKDDTIDIIKAFSEKGVVSKYISEKDEGIYNALNKGIKMSTGEIIGFLHSDDIYPNADVLRLVSKAFEDKTVEAVYGDLKYMTYDLKFVHRYWKSGRYKKGSFLYGWMPPHPTFFVRKSVYDKFGLFNESFKISADYELMLRMIHKNEIALHYIPKVLVHMRNGGVSNENFSNRVLANKEDRKAWEINGLKPNLLTLYLKPIRKIKQLLLKR